MTPTFQFHSYSLQFKCNVFYALTANYSSQCIHLCVHVSEHARECMHACVCVCLFVCLYVCVWSYSVKLSHCPTECLSTSGCQKSHCKKRMNHPDTTLVYTVKQSSPLSSSHNKMERSFFFSSNNETMILSQWNRAILHLAYAVGQSDPFSSLHSGTEGSFL